VESIGQLLGDKRLEDCIAEIKAIIEHMDFRWDQRVISKDEYVEKRRQLELEIGSLRPIDYGELIEAADLITNFRKYWNGCEAIEELEVARQQLISKIVERVFIYERKAIALIIWSGITLIKWSV
jgi:hypothetical protein